MVHNHGTETGRGLACRESIHAGRLVGDCIRYPRWRVLKRGGLWRVYRPGHRRNTLAFDTFEAAIAWLDSWTRNERTW